MMIMKIRTLAFYQAHAREIPAATISSCRKTNNNAGRPAGHFRHSASSTLGMPSGRGEGRGNLAEVAVPGS